MGYATMRQLAGGGHGVLASLVTRLPDEALPAAEAAARGLEPGDRARALLAIRDRLGTSRLDAEILAAARAAGDETTSLLLAWAAGAPGAAGAAPADRAPVLLEAVRGADDWERASAIAAAVGKATPEGLAPLLAEVRRVDGDALPEVIGAFDRRAADLPADVRAGVLALARAPRRRAAREERMAAAIHLLDAGERDGLVRVAMQRWHDGDESSTLTFATIRFWPTEARVALAAHWVSAADWDDDLDGLLAALEPSDIRAVLAEVIRRPPSSVPPEAIGSLLGHLPADDQADAVALVERRYRGARRVTALAGLARGHPAVLEAAFAGPGGGPPSDTWTAVIAELGQDVPAALVPRAVEVARGATDRRLRLRTLAMLAGRAGDPLRSAVTDEVVEGLAATPTALGWEGLPSLAQAATPAQAQAAIAIVRAHLRGSDRDDAVATLAGALDDPRLVDLIVEFAGPKPALAVRLLELYAASLSRPARARVMAATRRIRDTGDRAVARAVVLAAGGPVDDVTPEATLDLALGSGDDATSRVVDLLAGQLPPERTLRASLALREPGTRSWTLTNLEGRLPPAMAAAAAGELRALEAEGLTGGGGRGADGALDAVETATAADAAMALEALFPAAQPPPAHIAYGLLDAPAEVVVAEPFALEVGISEKQAAGVAGPALRLPPVSDTPYLLDVRIAAPGFTTPPGESRRRTLVVSRATPYPTTTVTLVPKPVADEPGARPVTAEFWAGGQHLGDAIRYVEVLPTAQARTRPEADRVQAGVDVPNPSSATDVPDLTISIRRSYPRGRTEWTLGSPHESVVTPDDPYEAPLEDEAAGLLASIGQIDAADGKKAVFADVLALGNRVRACIPDEVWTAIRAAASAASAAGGPPSILLQSEEPHVPWELARVEPPLVPGSTLPPFLAAQSRISRWVLATRMVDGRARPPVDAPRHKAIASVGVVAGSYRGGRWENLVHARAEARELQARFAARKILPTNEAMFELLKGTPEVDLLHFAVHGRYNPRDPGAESGIILTDGESLHANEVAARDLATHPVVFLNACQLAAGQLELGSYSGVAAAFVEAGACAVVAPLWRVDDGIAKDIALDFYDRVARGVPLSEVLRQAREQFVDSVDTTSATWMAYQLFAHPAFTVEGLPAGGPAGVHP